MARGPFSFPQSSRSWLIFCDADVLHVIDHPLLSRGPESDLLDAFVRNQLGNKNKNLKASSGGPEIRGPQSLFSLAWQNSPNNQKIRKKIFCFQGLKRVFSFHPPHQHDTIPRKKTNVFVRGGEEGRKEEKEINGEGEEEGGGEEEYRRKDEENNRERK